MVSTLPLVALGQPHVQAHNDERVEINAQGVQLSYNSRRIKNNPKTRRKLHELTVNADVTAFASSTTPLSGASLSVSFTTGGSAPALVLSNYNLVDWGQGQGMTPYIYNAGGVGWVSQLEPWLWAQKSLNFWTDSRYVSVPSYYGLSGGATVWVDGRPAASNPTVSIDANGYYINLTFNSNKPRLIEIKSDQFYAGVSIEPTAQIWRPSAMKGPRILVIGASLSQGCYATAYRGPFQRIDDYLGLPNIAVDGQGGSGFISPGTYDGSAGGGSYANSVRRTNQVNWKPDIVFVNEVLNDLQMTPQPTAATVEAAMVSEWSFLRTSFPNALLIQAKSIMTAYFKTILNGSVPGLLATIESDLDSGLLSTYDVKLMPPALGYITGTGDTGNIKNDGNADRYIGTDHAHPNTAGSEYLVGRYADSLLDIMEAA